MWLDDLGPEPVLILWVSTMAAGAVWSTGAPLSVVALIFGACGFWLTMNTETK